MEPTQIQESSNLNSQANDECPVAVVCITYNQEDYIAEALESFLMQETTFPFKILVSDDCSSDRTPEIITAYSKMDSRVIPILRTDNNGGPRNLRLTCQAAHTKYIALCEGDDYWIDPLKLQKQFDFMEQNPEVNACFCDTQIIANADWYLSDYYNKDDLGRMLIPSGIPGIDKNKREYTAGEYLSSGIQAHTSTLFYRWREDMPIMAEYDGLLAGDNVMFMMVVSNGIAGYLPEVVSAYRKTDDNHSTVAFKNWSENALIVQNRWVEQCEYLHRWFTAYCYDRVIITAIENRTKHAASLYLQELINQNDNEAIAAFFLDHPRSACNALNAYLSFYRDSKLLTASLGWPSYVAFVRNSRRRKYLSRCAKPYEALEKVARVALDKADSAKFLMHYWMYSLHPKDDSLWVLTSFRKKGYLDNSRYFYEYLVNNDPEVNAIWLSNDKDVIKSLELQGLPVERMNSKKGKRILKKAAVAVTDHFKSSDYNNTAFNRGTQVVQLWHGSGIKGMKNLGNTKEAGVVYSDDILRNEKDSFITVPIKAVKRFFCEPFREMQENYLLLEVSNTQDRINAGSDWHTPYEAFFVNGSPRNALLSKVANGFVTEEMEHLYASRPDIEFRVLYAPTYRYDEAREHAMLLGLCDAVPDIEACMSRLHGEFVIRLHPHTWRNYSEEINWKIKGCDHIRVDREPDVYATLGIYDLLISDYSSIATDFLLFERPMVFFRPDHDEFLKEENDLRYDPDEYCPGPKTSTWEETLAAIENYHLNPEEDLEWRKRIHLEVFDPAFNDEDNPKRLAAEIKARLHKRKK